MPPHPKYFQVPMSPAPPAPLKKESPRYPKPLLRLELRDLSLPGTAAFLKHLDPTKVIEEAVEGVLRLLYTSQSDIPSTRSVTLIVRSMGGVAYTTGKDIDDDHKEIHFSTDYINQIDPKRLKEEMLGVIRHEMVHCWQFNAEGTAPGGLIEGIADWVRLRSDLVPPHWRKEADGDWDAGYQHTGYFLDYLENRFGGGTVCKLNQKLRKTRYHEDEFWLELTGHKVHDLWKAYGQSLQIEAPAAKKEAVDNQPTADAKTTAPSKKPMQTIAPSVDDFMPRSLLDEVLAHVQKEPGWEKTPN